MITGLAIATRGLLDRPTGLRLASRGFTEEPGGSAGLTAFIARLGFDQGRIVATSAEPTDGSHVWLLGSDQDDWIEDLAAGDHVTISQVVDVTPNKFLRVDATIRTPNDLPAGLAWEVALMLDGVAASRRRGWPRRTRRITDLVANVSQLVGLHELGIRLELVAT